MLAPSSKPLPFRFLVICANFTSNELKLLSVPASLSTIAAQDYRIRDRVKFVNFFAGYYDATDLVRSIGSRTRFYEGYTVPWDPDKLTMQIFMEHLIEGVSESNDRELLTDIFVKRKKCVAGFVHYSLFIMR